MRYSLISLMLMTAWLGSQLGLYATMPNHWSNPWVFEQVALTWAPVVIGLACFVKVHQRIKAALIFLSIAGVLYSLACSCRLELSPPAPSWAVHVAVQIYILAIDLFAVGVVLFVLGQRVSQPMELKTVDELKNENTPRPEIQK